MGLSTTPARLRKAEEAIQPGATEGSERITSPNAGLNASGRTMKLNADFGNAPASQI